MREYISVEREANAIRLRRSTFLGAFLLLEGSSDKIFYERFINIKTCQSVSLSGKPSSKLRVIEVLKILEQSTFQGVLAIVDADFDHLDTSSHYCSNLLRTDSHDLETMLINSFALDKVIAEFGSEEKLINFDRDVRTTLLEAGMSIGYLLWLSQRDELNLTFDGIKFSKFINEQTLQIDEFKLIQEVQNKSQAFLLKNEDLQQRLTNLKSNSHDPWQVCCGHDLVEILCLGLRKAIGSTNRIEPNSLESSLRLAYEEAYFLKTQIYSGICTWESNNQPFKVLRNYT